MARKKTHEEFMKDFEEKQPEFFARVEVLEEYKGATVKIKCKCLIDGYEWETTPNGLLNGHGCPRCSGKERYTTDSFKEKILSINPNIEILGEYCGAFKNIECQCNIDKHKWSPQPYMLIQGQGCPKCAGLAPYTTESFKEKMKEINPNIEIIGEYINSKTKIKCGCLIDGYEWETTPSVLLKGHRCPRCSNREKYTTQSFIEKIAMINPNIEIIGEYIDAETKILYKCLKCSTIFSSRPADLIQGHGCPKCAHIGTSWLQEQIEEYFSTKYTILSRDTSIIGMELDIVIPELKLAIEPGSWYWHYEVTDKRDRDGEKRRLCAEKGYTCITIYDACNEPELVPFKDEDTCLIYEDDIGTHKYLLDDVLDSIEDIIKTK